MLLLSIQNLNLVQAMDCRHMGIIELYFSGNAVDWRTILQNYTGPGGWKAVACVGFAQTKGKHLA
ncbi:hypothetical protein [Kaistella sp.]|uniref:hypothetical protein n=1 Tax=Kaistella sp. TaxID=2782235 RepID=UPI002F943937